VKRVLIDSDVILDVALVREPFWPASKLVLGRAETRHFSGFVSSNSVANLYYILRKAGGDLKARSFLRTLLSYLKTAPVGHDNLLQALSSPFGDFEDAVQNEAATSEKCDCIVTRNVDDFQESLLEVLTPAEFVATYLDQTP
jgi:predicted nucleic acid-binding protein